ncbi:MAG: hypothetical protein M1833_004341 [Piccolia ochrophora]|nr:MAG: hypothetical protein M1833_004341 [Piccolia ochrophora]
MQNMFRIPFILFLHLFVSSRAAPPPLTPEIIQQAGGGLINQPPPQTLSAPTLDLVQLAQFISNEKLAYFDFGIENIPKWGLGDFPNNTLEIIQSFRAQAIVDLNSAEGLLTLFDRPTIPACQYDWNQPGIDINSTDGYLGIAKVVIEPSEAANIAFTNTAALNDPTVAYTGASAAAVEARQDAWLRTLAGQKPAPHPWDTIIPSEWAYLVYQNFVVPGSCPVALPYRTLNPFYGDFGALSLKTVFGPTLQFFFNPDTTPAPPPGGCYFVAWINQLNKPIYTRLHLTAPGQGTTDVPAELTGVIYAALTSTEEPTDVAGVDKVLLAGPFLAGR